METGWCRCVLAAFIFREIELGVCFSVSEVNYAGKSLRDGINERSAARLSALDCLCLPCSGSRVIGGSGFC